MHRQLDDEVRGAATQRQLVPPGRSQLLTDVPTRPVALPTLVRLTSSEARVPDGGALELAAQVRTIRGEGPAASGDVEFRIGPTLVGRVPVDGTGRAVLDGIHLDAGVHAVTATYLGDDHHAAATSAPLPQAVAVHLAPVVVLVAPPTPVPSGIALEAEILDPRTGRLAEAATGRLEFSTDGVVVATVDVAAGHARVVVNVLPAGRLSARFAGDAEHAPAFGNLLGAFR